MRQATSMPMTSASSSARPEAPRCSANARMADATGAAGWMMVFRWVSSKSKVCDVMPLSSAALAMSSRSERPSTAACGAGSSICRAASAASAAGGRAAPMAQPSQLYKVRTASRSTASFQPRPGWVLTKRARMAVMAGGAVSAATGVLRVKMGLRRGGWKFAALRLHVETNIARFRERAPALHFGGDVLTEFSGCHGHRLDGLERQFLAQRRVVQRRHLGLVQTRDDVGRHLRRAERAVPLSRHEPLEARLVERRNALQQRVAPVSRERKDLHAVGAQIG